MSEVCKTITVETENGPVRINETDFDSKTMKAAKDQSEPLPTPVAEPETENKPVQMLVVKNKTSKKFEVVDDEGNPVEAEGIDPAGYDDEAAAWAAIMAVNTANA